MKNVVKAKPLSQAQMMVWQIVKDMESEKDLSELRDLLLDFYESKMQQHLDKTVAEKGYIEADFEKMLYGHDRKTS
ncbi:MAG: hypothetical protein JSU01_16465 [Bacteroidetes bacterium]|nr:hypothetical protein [Bacteroidota bacterium]